MGRLRSEAEPFGPYLKDFLLRNNTGFHFQAVWERFGSESATVVFLFCACPGMVLGLGDGALELAACSMLLEC